MTYLEPKAAARDGGRRDTDAHGGDRAQKQDRAAKANAKALEPDIRDLRVRALGRDFIIRHDANDPNWRMLALLGLDPLSAAAFAVRAAPHTDSERLAFALWGEAEMRRIEGAAE